MKQLQLEKDIPLLDIGHKYQIGGLVMNGQGRSFVITMPYRGDDLSEPLDQLQLTQDGMEAFLRQLDLLEVELFTPDENGKIIKQIVRKSQRQIEAKNQWVVFRRDNFTCRYCGNNHVPLSVDHIDLWEDGGPSIVDNMLTACKPCNRDRGNMKYEKWVISPMYEKKSANLPTGVKLANLAVVQDLPRLRTLRLQNVRSR